jgi:hypothetical protein
MLLTQPWPPDLDPAQAGFKQWTETILRRHGYWDDPTRLDTLTADEFLAIETAGPIVLADLIEKGNAATAWHKNLRSEQRRGHSVVVRWDDDARRKLRRIADRKWAHQVWRRDPRFVALLPSVDATVGEIATKGTIDDRKALLRNLPLLQERLAYYAVGGKSRCGCSSPASPARPGGTGLPESHPAATMVAMSFGYDRNERDVLRTTVINSLNRRMN